MLSIFNWFGYRALTHAEGFRLIKQAGFEGVLLWWDTIDGAEHCPGKLCLGTDRFAESGLLLRQRAPSCPACTGIGHARALRAPVDGAAPARQCWQ